MKCQIEDCKIQRANYNYPNTKPGIYCCTHKLDGMIDVHHKHCEENKCYIFLIGININGNV